MAQVIRRKSKLQAIGCPAKCVESRARIVNQNIDMALSGRDSGSQLTHLLLVRDIRPKELRPPGTRSTAQLGRKLGSDRFTSAHQDEVGSGSAQSDGCGSTDSGGGPCNNTCSPLKWKRGQVQSKRPLSGTTAG